MRVIIAGGREFTNLDYVTVENACLLSGYWFSTVVSGRCRGVDELGEQFARSISVEVDPYPADWAKHGKSAGRIRNELMATKADALIAVWDGRSVGTAHMIQAARNHSLLVHVCIAVPTPLMPRAGPHKGL